MIEEIDTGDKDGGLVVKLNAAIGNGGGEMSLATTVRPGEDQPALRVFGKIYDPNSGKTYDSKISVNTNGTLKVEGCILVICQAQTWKRG